MDSYLDNNWLSCEKKLDPYASASGSYSREADEIRLDYEILKVLYRLDFYFIYSSAMLLVAEVHFSLLFPNKAYSRMCFVVCKI